MVNTGKLSAISTARLPLEQEVKELVRMWSIQLWDSSVI